MSSAMVPLPRLGNTFAATWERCPGRPGRVCAGSPAVEVATRSNVVGEIPDWDPARLDYVDRKEASLWNAGFIFLTMEVCREALANAGLVMDQETGPRTGCLIGSALNGTDAYRIAMDNYVNRGPLKVSPYLLPNLCANLPAGKAGMLLGFTGPVFSPQGACASGNHAIAIGARMIRDGDCDFVLAGGVETCLVPEIIQGFANMLATIKVGPKDRAFADPSQASRPFSIDRKGFVLSEGAGVVVLAAEEAVRSLGLTARAEVAGIGWNSDAHHFTRPNPETIVRAIRGASRMRRLPPGISGRSTPTAPRLPPVISTEVECLRAVFGRNLPRDTRVGQQVPDRPQPGRLRGHRGGPGHRGHGPGDRPAHGQPYPGPGVQRPGCGAQSGPQTRP